MYFVDSRNNSQTLVNGERVLSKAYSIIKGMCKIFFTQFKKVQYVIISMSISVPQKYVCLRFYFRTFPTFACIAPQGLKNTCHVGSNGKIPLWYFSILI